MYDNCTLQPECQLDCPDFDTGHNMRNHHVRMYNPCLKRGTAMCPLPTGQACSIEKMNRIRSELKVSGLKLDSVY